MLLVMKSLRNTTRDTCMARAIVKAPAMATPLIVELEWYESSDGWGNQ